MGSYRLTIFDSLNLVGRNILSVRFNSLIVFSTRIIGKLAASNYNTTSMKCEVPKWPIHLVLTVYFIRANIVKESAINFLSRHQWRYLYYSQGLIKLHDIVPTPVFLPIVNLDTIYLFQLFRSP